MDVSKNKYVILGELYNLTNEMNVEKYFNEVLKIPESKRIEQLDVLNPFISNVLNHLEPGDIISINNRFEPRLVGYFNRISDSPIVINDSVIGIQLELQNGMCKEIRTYDGRNFVFKTPDVLGDKFEIYPYSDVRVGEKAVEELLRLEGLDIKKFVRSQWSKWDLIQR